MSYTRENLIADVTKEAEALRVHATEEERGNLDIESLDPDNKTLCIYGLITGHCHNKRAAELINKCAIRHFENIDSYNMESVEAALEDKPKNFINARTQYLDGFTYSAIEAYICLPDAKNANLIAYLKGETDKLDL